MEKKTIEKAPSAKETTHIPTIYQEITPHKVAYKMEKKTIEKAPSAKETTNIPTIYQEITPHEVGGSASSIQNGKEDD
ncbi:hypothetical protein T4D_2028 [Trichinella pseudospiralis]|uniref:Uncharacterized protein n=1 Tax=Trichinella pseudospiralis TaxID=6337 RepID=A0A0V1FQS2_TRIPS|nr:hypothetical protein T4D_2028 [Trichinella pseudospiralis]